jgi:hypothetical protein
MQKCRIYVRTLLAKKECVGGMGHSSETVVIISTCIKRVDVKLSPA